MWMCVCVCVCVCVCSSDEEKETRRKQVRPLFRHFRRIDACLQPREAFRGSDESRTHTHTHTHTCTFPHCSLA